MRWRRLLAMLLLPLMGGCLAPRGTPPTLAQAEQADRQSLPPRAVPVVWDRPPCAQFDTCRFAGDRYLHAPIGERVLRALDPEGRIIWEFPTDSNVADITLNYEQEEALVLTMKSAHRISLRDGRRLGPGPPPVPGSDHDGILNYGFLTWSGDYLLREALYIVPPVNPAAPGKSPQYVRNWLLRLNRADGTWEDLGLLLEKGAGLASVSRDGRTILLHEDRFPVGRVFRDGKLQAVFNRAYMRWYYLSDGGDYVVGRNDQTLALFTAEGQLVWTTSDEGYPAIISSRDGQVRIVLRYDPDASVILGPRKSQVSGFRILDGQGKTVAEGTGEFEGQPGLTHFLVGNAEETRLFDLNGRLVATYPAGTRQVGLTADGRSVTMLVDGKIWVYAVPE